MDFFHQLLFSFNPKNVLYMYANDKFKNEGGKIYGKI